MYLFLNSAPSKKEILLNQFFFLIIFTSYGKYFAGISRTAVIIQIKIRSFRHEKPPNIS